LPLTEKSTCPAWENNSTLITGELASLPSSAARTRSGGAKKKQSKTAKRKAFLATGPPDLRFRSGTLAVFFIFRYFSTEKRRFPAGPLAPEKKVEDNR
jgi:hypothetical protein